jgi:methanogenic corrinoid protein MtbC1/DNA-binding XRE family transcriptional regulator
MNSNQKKYLKYILSGDRQAAGDLIDQCIADRWPPIRIYSSILVPAQRQLGRLWAEGKISIATEHLASQITLEVLDRIRSAIRPADRLPHKVLVTAIEGDRHFIGARMAADLFLAQGWEVDFLGPDTPTEDLADLVSRRKPDLAVLSISLEDLMDRLGKTIESLRHIKSGPRILVGGTAISRNIPAEKIGADAVTYDLESALNAARKLLEGESKEKGLELRLKHLGRTIQHYRRLRGWNQQKLARNADLDRTYISLVERGGQNISLLALFRLAEALQVSPETLLQGDS